MTKNSIFCLLLLFIMFGCQKSFDSKEELMQYVLDKENGMRYSKHINGVDFELQYRPTDMLVSQELGFTSDDGAIDALRHKYEKYMYFNLSMSKNGQELLNNVVTDKGKFGEMLNNLSFGMENKVSLYTVDKDTLPMADFIYPRTFGISGNTAIMIAFPRDKKKLNNDYLNLVIEDLGLETGDVKFRINTAPIKNEPTCNFQSK